MSSRDQLDEGRVFLWKAVQKSRHSIWVLRGEHPFLRKDIPSKNRQHVKRLRNLKVYGQICELQLIRWGGRSRWCKLETFIHSSAYYVSGTMLKPVTIAGIKQKLLFVWSSDSSLLVGWGEDNEHVIDCEEKGDRVLKIDMLYRIFREDLSDGSFEQMPEWFGNKSWEIYGG